MNQSIIVVQSNELILENKTITAQKQLVATCRRARKLFKKGLEKIKIARHWTSKKKTKPACRSSGLLLGT
jgi:hypothetical protein